MMHGKVTLDGKETSLFNPIASALRSAGLHTLQLGKPGNEYFSAWVKLKWFYNQSMYFDLKWEDLLNNVRDAIHYVESAKPCDAKRIVLLGHSEGTMVSVDIAATTPSVSGIILLGYTGGPYERILNWQLFERPFEWLISRDVDANRDTFISRSEAGKWPEAVAYPWQPDENQVSITKLRELQRQNPESIKFIETFHQSPLVSDGIWNRPALHEKAASLTQPILAFTGELDVQTPVTEMEALLQSCRSKQKTNCETHIIPGVGHGFSAPKPPRSQPLLDLTLGPVSERFLKELTQTVEGWSGTRPL
jgi:pimeloyl-ACP methyl ester carboxylesterase